MNFEEHAAKPLLAAAGIAVPASKPARTPEAAAAAQKTLGPVVVKAQVPTSKRGKAGGIRKADTPEQTRATAEAILGMTIDGHRVESVLVESRADIKREFYTAVMNDPASKGPLVLFSTLGGMDIEEAAAKDANAIRRAAVDIRDGFGATAARAMLKGLDLGGKDAQVADVLARLYQVYRDNDAELIEINPLAVTGDGRMVALDCKFVMDDSAVKRHEELTKKGTPEKFTGLEAKGRAIGLRYIELDGDVGVLANGAGLTMTTMDVVCHHGGKPANFLEIGGEAYTQAKPALELVLANPNVRSLVINFCGAFARTDVMTVGVLAALDAIKPKLPIHWSVHGTGDVEARAMLKEKLGVM
ncbi:MAG: succinate--CoA ligase subunit beta, partial [Rhodospirillales bacterium]